MTRERFAQKLLVALAGSTPTGNVVASPQDILEALRLLWLGAGGSTQTLLATAPGVTEGTLEVPPPVKEVEEVRAVWVRESVKLLPAYVRSVEACCRAQVGALPEGREADAINAWVAQATHQMIPHLIDEADPCMGIVLTTAIYLKARWSPVFLEEATVPDTFHLEQGARITVPFMRTDYSFAYAHTSHYEWVRLPCRDSSLAMDILLPHSLQDLNGLVEALLRTGMAPPKEMDGTLKLPRCELAWGASLRPGLAALGLSGLLDGTERDYSRMSHRPLTLDRVLHRAAIELDEEGTRAAAATDVQVVVTGIRPAEPPPRFNMIVNRPFLLAIRDVKDGGVLFVALVRDPGGM